MPELSLSLPMLGTASLALAMAVAVYAVAAGIMGAIRHDARLQTSARYAAIAVFMAMTTAVLTMQTALLTDDFSVEYVAQTSRAASPLWVKVVTMWAALEGSILLWAWLASGYTAVVAFASPNNALRNWAIVVLNVVSVFFISVNAFVANPFTLVPNPPMDGPGPNPLLQNHWMMAVHPVLMYLGFVGLTVPFAFAMSALINKRPGSEWMSQTRAWTISGWGFLGIAKIAGGWWSYEVLGWGGYWAWDPVENVSFLPWLTATAFLHSVQVQERRRMLKAWNLLLIILTFALTILGTFIIRSGVVSSVHAFGDGPVGPYFLAFFLLVVLVSFGLLMLRWDQVRDHGELDAIVSREGSFLLGNVLFLAMTFAVLLGTLFPLFVEAVSGDKVTVGAPFFNQVSLPIWLAIFALMGIGPLLPWRKASHQSLVKNLAWMVGIGLVSALIAYVAGVRKVYPLWTVGFAGYNFASIVLLLDAAIRPRMRISGRGFWSVFGQYAVESRRRFGSIIVHFSVIIMALGVAGSGGYRVDEQVRIEIGESVTLDSNYRLEVVDRFMEQTPYRVAGGVLVNVHRGNRQIASLRPKINVFLGQEQQPVPTPDVLYTVWQDIYLSVSGTVSPDQDFVVLRVVQSPLVAWIWVGAVIMLVGTFYCLLPKRRYVPVPARQAVPAS
ncbi:MAG: heme lyase CcmF/NrfE family subunit [Deinococcota bacterium]